MIIAIERFDAKILFDTDDKLFDRVKLNICNF